MPANIRRKVLRAQQFGRPPPEPKAPKKDKRKATLARAAAAEAAAASSLRPDEDEDVDEDGGVALRSDDDALAGSADGEADETSAATAAKAKEPKPRYILFVGNLPFDATTEGVEAHFAAVRPTQVRHRTEKATGRSRGFAFVEFDSHARMDACLTRYHRSEYLEGHEAGAVPAAAATKEAEAEAEAEAEPDAEAMQTLPAQDGGKKEGPKGARRINVQLT